MTFTLYIEKPCDWLNKLTSSQVSKLLQVEKGLESCTTFEEARKVYDLAPDACFQNWIYPDEVYVVVIRHFADGSNDFL